MRGYFCLLIVGLAAVAISAESEGTETKDETYGGLSPNADKTKRGAVKISNADSPTFNHLTSNSGGSSSGSGNGSSGGSNGSRNPVGTSGSTTGFKPILPSNVSPLRYFQNGQYQQYQQYQQYLPLTYYQPSHSAAQIAAQYSFQGAPVAHYLQTPTQVQYVSAPSMAQLPFVKYQGFDYSTRIAGSDGSATSSAASTSPVASSASSQQTTHSHQGVGSGVQTTAASVQTSVQPKDYFLYQAPKPVYYAQQPLVFLVQPQAAAATATNFLYQQPGVNYYIKHQQPQQYFSLQPTSRFAMYPMTQTSQLYLVPMTLSSSAGQDSTSANELKSSAKVHVGSQQHAASTGAFAYGNKG